MRLSEASIRRPVLATMLNAALVLFGIIGLTRLPVRELPDIDPPIVNVNTSYRGASAAVVETQITEPLEEAIASVEGIRTLTSESREQSSNITVEFDLSRNIDVAAQDVRDRVARVRGRLPEDVDEPGVFKQDADAQPMLWVAVSSDRHAMRELTTLVEAQFKDRLQAVPGVSSVTFGGAKRLAIRLWLDAGKMAARGVTILDVERALREQSVELPSGIVEGRQRELAIQLRGELKTPEEYNQLVIARRGLAFIRLHDIGHAELGVEDESSTARFTGRPAVGVGVVKQSKANTIRVARGVRAELERLRPTLPAGIQLAVPYDESEYVERAINEVWVTLGISFVLVLITIFIFLQNLRATIIPTLAIPVSIIATFGFMYFLGFSINIVTMLALVLAIGVVVDDAIVVLENIYRHIEEGKSPMEAAFIGMREIAFAIIVTTIALAAVFLPMAFQTSATGRLFIELAVVISASVGISAFVALTLSPTIAARLLRPHAPPRVGRRLAAYFEQRLDRFSAWYGRRLDAALRRPGLMMLGTLAALVISGVLYARLEKEFLPDEDKGRLFCIFLTPEGSTSEYTDRMVRTAETILRATPEVDVYFAATALSRGGRSRQSNQGLAFVRLKDQRQRSVQDIVAGPQGLGAQFFRNIEGAIAIPSIPKAIGRGFGQNFQLILQHHDLNVLNRITQDVANRLRREPYLMNVRPTFELNKPELRLTIDRNRAAALGVSIEGIARTVQVLFGGQDLSRISLAGKEYEVIAQLERAERLTPTDLERLYVRSADGHLVPLSSVVTSTVAGGPSAIRHYDRARAATIEATPQGVALGTAIERVERILRDELPAGARYTWSGEARDLKTAGRETLFVLGLAVLIIYMTLAAQFESWVHPLTVMLTVPLGLIGAVGLLWLLAQVNVVGMMLYGWSHYAPHPPAIAGWLSAVVPRIPAMGVNLFSQIGMVLLLGLVTKNGILLVEFANQRRVQGLSAVDAMREAGRIRLRPILMTATTTIAGILPVAIGFGAGAESRRPMGVAALGGMLTSTMLTLFVIPTAYVWFDRLAHRRQHRQPTTLPRVVTVLLACMIAASTMGGCAVGPNYRRPDAAVPSTWKEAEGLTWATASPRDAEPKGAWWELFGDETLNLLEVQAAASNQEIAGALARLESARAAARLPTASWVPTLTANPSYSKFQRSLGSFGGRGSLQSEEYRVPFDLSYEVDLWGKVRRSFEAARADADASAAALETMQLTVAAEVARTYFTLRALDLEIAAVRDALALRRESLTLAEDRWRAGIVSGIDVERLRADVETADTTRFDLARRRSELEHALAVLCGQPPAAFIVAPIETWTLEPPLVPLDVPSTVLERRPDVAQAERAVAAANARIGVAVAAAFPVLKLTGSAGWQAVRADDLFKTSSEVWSFGPSLSAPLFAGGRNKAERRIARGEHGAAVAAYRQAVLTALQEVEDAVAAIRWLDEERMAHTRAVASTTGASAMARERYRAGLSGYVEVIDAERARLDAVRRAAQVHGLRLSATARLIKALGGGWTAAAGAP